MEYGVGEGNTLKTDMSDHHRFIRISNQSQEEFINEIQKTQIKTKNQQSRDLISSYFKDTTVYEKESGLYIIRHLAFHQNETGSKIPMPHENVFCHSIFLHHSSPLWWENIEKFLDEDKNFDFRNYFNWPHLTSGEFPRKLINGSSEDPVDRYYVKKNIALNIQGWDFNDPPMEFIIIGNPSNIPIPRFSASGTEGLVISFSSNENGEMRNASVLDGGKNYFINDKVLAHYGQISGAIVQVVEVDDGVCTKVKVLSGGQNYPMIGTATTTMYGWDGVFGETHFPKHPNLFL